MPVYHNQIQTRIDNKQGLLDTPAVNALTCKQKEEKCLSHRCHFVKNYFFAIKFLHANVQWVYIMKAQYEIVSSKTVVGVDRPVNALTCTQKEEKLSKFS